MHLPLILTAILGKVIISLVWFLGCQWPMLLYFNRLIIFVFELYPIKSRVYRVNCGRLFSNHIFVHQIICQIPFFKVLVWKRCWLILDLKMLYWNVLVILVWNIWSRLYLTFQIFILFIWVYIWFIILIYFSTFYFSFLHLLTTFYLAVLFIDLLY